MKYIDQVLLTLEYLELWASTPNIVFASFFWNPRTLMQKSQITAGASAELTPQISITETESHPESPSGSSTALQYTPSLKPSFVSSSTGLMSLMANRQSLMGMLVDMSRSYNIKILAASRPWLLIQDAEDFDIHTVNIALYSSSLLLDDP
ncbi:hypothetical protein GX50_01471 [[Emmonsia] crescens]|uniref:Uncharacterized protein n=1 Tax=[Emmonsia] crescens TaxID=73230 RepID=A0A2B7ZQZ9_9EURO|nr:hypothetical protein GX50_01471 [Emmonsia crescens]